MRGDIQRLPVGYSVLAGDSGDGSGGSTMAVAKKMPERCNAQAGTDSKTNSL